MSHHIGEAAAAQVVQPNNFFDEMLLKILPYVQIYYYIPGTCMWVLVGHW